MSIPSISTSSNSAAGLISALGGGSGVDVSALARSLVAAERAPQEALIDSGLKTTQARISGYGAVLSSLSQLKSSFEALQDQSKLNSRVVQSNAQGYFDVTASAAAVPGRHTVNILSLAVGKSSMSDGFATATTALNGDAPITLNLSVGNPAVSTALTVSSPTPSGIATAINHANVGISARIVNTGSGVTPYRIVISATATGAAATFSVSNDATGADGSSLTFSSSLESAADAHLVINGVEMWRSSNTVSDAIPGLSLSLNASTSTDGTLANSVPRSINIARDTSGVKANLRALVGAYNSARGLLATVADSKSKVADTGATLVNDSLVRQIQFQITQMVTSTSSTPGANGQGALRDLGITIQRDGTLALAEEQLDSALRDNFTGVVTMLSADKENSGRLLPGSRGLAGDAVQSLTSLMERGGPIVAASDNANSKVTDYNERKAALELRMQGLLNQYTTQFAAMERMVGELKSLRTSLANQFTAWANQRD